MPDMRNFVNLVGYLGRDAELRSYVISCPESGDETSHQCVELSLCTNSLSEPVFHDVVGYRANQVEHLGCLKSGEKLMVTGYLYYDRSEKKGVTRIHPKVVVETFELMHKPKSEPSAPRLTAAMAS